MKYKVGSFNVRNLSGTDAAKGATRDLDMIAGIINQFDIIALQEVLGEGKILTGINEGSVSGQAAAYEYSLRSRLRGEWEIRWLDPHIKGTEKVGQDERGEGYAFLWRKDKFTLPKDEYGKEIEPCIFGNYKVNKKAGESRLVRDPAYGRFQPVDMPTAEIRLITTHIIFNKPSSDNGAEGAYSKRKNEFKIIAKDIYTRISENHNQIHDAAVYTIILGDYNMNLRESGASYPFVSPVMAFDSHHNEIGLSDLYDSQGAYFIRTEQADLSTVNRDGNNYASNYDHFSYDESVKAKVIKECPHRMESVVKDAGGFNEYKTRVSDHIPVMVEISFEGSGAKDGREAAQRERSNKGGICAQYVHGLSFTDR